MIRYESDDKAISRALDALNDGETIDHGTARAIASGYNDYRTAHFVSTGRMEIDAEFLMSAIRRGVDAETLESDAEALSALEVYLRERESASDIDRVPGWSDMWVPKHVDYPHESGQLDRCWCFEEDNTEEPEGCQLCRHIGHGPEEPCRP